MAVASRRGVAASVTRIMPALYSPPAAAMAAPAVMVSAAAASSSRHVLASVRSFVHSACSGGSGIAVRTRVLRDRTQAAVAAYESGLVVPARERG